jgi:flagellar hook protein FlgE
VDLTEEFSDLIATQRAFEAAARTMSVSDQMLVELLALRR